MDRGWKRHVPLLTSRYTAATRSGGAAISTAVWRWIASRDVTKILGVVITEVGEALAFASRGIAVLAALFFVINTIYFSYSEEPGLEKRFGQQYIEYKRNVPRWLPRLRPWQPS